MIKHKKTFIKIFKLLVIVLVVFYLFNNIDTNFIENIYKYYFIIFITIPIFLFKIFINALKISYLLKILNKKKEDFVKILKLLITAQLSMALPASFLASKAWVDTNLVRHFNLNFKDYFKFNFYILLCTIILFAIIFLLNYHLNLVIFFLLISFFSILIFKKIRFYLLYFYCYLANILLNISISYIVINFISPEIINENFLDIFLSSLISIYLDAVSILPFNIGYSQMTYGISFELFTLPKNIAFTIATIKQISQIIIVVSVLLFVSKKFKFK